MITAIDCVTSLLRVLATRPEQWERLRAEPERVPAAFDEALRDETPSSCSVAG